jgi:hypothetical protein
MPTSESILSGLSTIANEATAVAVLWHVVLFAALAALIRGWRPARRTAGCLLALPLASVSMAAFVFGNPFNGSIFAFLSALLAVLGRRLGTQRVALATPWIAASGALLITFGSAYPHFLRTSSSLAYLIAAPTGLVPCPTLSVVIGFTLLGGTFGARAWASVLAAAGAFYGIYGALRLGVRIDIFLLLGAALLFLVALLPERRARA